MTHVWRSVPTATSVMPLSMNALAATSTALNASAHLLPSALFATLRAQLSSNTALLPVSSFVLQANSLTQQQHAKYVILIVQLA